MKYLVTGGFGYVGSWTVRRLLQLGHEVHVLSRSGAVPEALAGCRPIRADLATQSVEELARLLPSGLDGCVHAASANESFMPDYARTALLTNAWGTRLLLEALVGRAKRDAAALPVLVYLSTFHVLGRQSGEITCTTPPEPQNDYALTHLFAEEYCRFFARSEGLPAVIVRLTNGYGAPITPVCNKWYLLFNDVCRQAWTERKITVRSNPALQRDFVWLGDVAECLGRLLARRDLAGRTLLLSSGTAVTLEQVAATIQAAARERLQTDIALEFTRQAETQPPLHVDNTPLREALGVVFQNKMHEEAAAVFDFLHRFGDGRTG